MTAKGHRPGRRAGKRCALSPGLEHGAPDGRASQDLGHVPWVAADEVEEPTLPRSRRDGGRLRVATLQDRQLLELEPELLEPTDRVLDRYLRASASRCGRHHKSRPWSSRRGEQPVLLFVAGIELVPTDQRKHARASANARRHPHIEREFQSDWGYYRSGGPAHPRPAGPSDHQLFRRQESKLSTRLDHLPAALMDESMVA